MSHRFQIQVKTISSRRRGIPADYASFSGAAEVKITNDFAITRLPFLSSRAAQKTPVRLGREGPHDRPKAREPTVRFLAPLGTTE
ncbi:MAG: hypothetical protein DMF14_08795 [Verrucomicrobia bacterium]|nr:MAG: hypothetical protein DMF14_08795 [Verrucomicrobiota bacterium]